MAAVVNVIGPVDRTEFLNIDAAGQEGPADARTFQERDVKRLGESFGGFVLDWPIGAKVVGNAPAEEGFSEADITIDAMVHVVMSASLKPSSAGALPTT